MFDSLFREKTSKYLYVLSFFLFLLFVTLYFSMGAEFTSRFLFNSDILYFPTLYKDLFIDHYHLSGWYIPGAPNIFPDMLLYFFLMFITNKVSLAMYFFAIIQFGLILFLFRKLMMFVFPKLDYFSLTLGNIILSFFFLITLIDRNPYLSFHLVSNTYHLGSFLNVIVALVLSFQFITKHKKINLIFLVLIGIIAVVSDRLFIVMYCVPFTLALFLFIRNKSNRFSILYIFSAIIVMVVSGLVLFDRISHNDSVHVARAYSDISMEGILKSWNYLTGSLSDYLKNFNFFGLIIILSFFSLVIAILQFFKSIPELWNRQNFSDTNSMFIFWNIYFIAFMFVVFLTPVFTGSFQGFDTIRYNIFVFYLGPLYLGIILIQYFKNSRTVRKIVAFSSIIGIAFLFVYMGIYFVKEKPLTGFKNFVSYYPDVAHTVDILSEKYELKQGVSTYWLGKVATLFSKNNLRLYTVYDENLVPYSHVGNENWYYKTGYGRYDSPVFNFVLLQLPVSDSALSVIEQRAGKILQKEELNGYLFVKLNDFVYERGQVFPVGLGKDYLKQ
ncbi:MAG: hypothetical protein H6538_08190 [Bacteroidales bacterium]|nr:hypothetical protein [Bacteroidales bacterium]MCB8998918.1 hypothetical protein [Bacteroidales bacterium]